MKGVSGAVCAVALVLLSPGFGNGQTLSSTAPAQAAARFSSQSWCEDALTVCFGNRSVHNASFSGIRLVFEPNLGVIFQNGNNRFQNTSFKALERVGVETNLRKGYVALQTLLIYPSTVEFDEKSPITSFITDGSRKVGVDYGLSLGLSFLDGILAAGIGYLDYDQRDLREVNDDGERQPYGTTTDLYLYFNVQPVSAIRSALRR